MIDDIIHYFNITLSVLKILSAILTLGFVAAIIYFLFRFKEIDKEEDETFKSHFFTPEPEKNPEKERWDAIVELFSSQDPNSWRLAIIDADSMLEDCMRSLGYSGETMGDVMKQMQQVPWIQAAWDVHLLRNKLAHEGSRYFLTEREVFRAFKIYENIFFETGYIS